MTSRYKLKEYLNKSGVGYLSDIVWKYSGPNKINRTGDMFFKSRLYHILCHLLLIKQKIGTLEEYISSDGTGYVTCEQMINYTLSENDEFIKLNKFRKYLYDFLEDDGRRFKVFIPSPGMDEFTMYNIISKIMEY